MAQIRMSSEKERLGGFAGPGADQGWGKDDAFRGGHFLTQASLKGREVKFGSGGEM
jgi:hypothetical protein